MLGILASLCLTMAIGPQVAVAQMPPMYVRATGIGHPPPKMRGAQARLMARRAAEVSAVRNLAVELNLGPRARVPAFRYVSTRYLANGTVEVTVEAEVTFAPPSPPPDPEKTPPTGSTPPTESKPCGK